MYLHIIIYNFFVKTFRKKINFGHLEKYLRMSTVLVCVEK
jgi:hypothetical protein